jgi:signal transduction histidine kinase
LDTFKRFHPQEEFEGTGVGPAIAKNIVNPHGGTIWAEREIDTGSTFYFTL